MADIDASYAMPSRSASQRMMRSVFGSGIPYLSFAIFGLVVIAAIGGEAIAPHDPNGLDLGSAFRLVRAAEQATLWNVETSHLLTALAAMLLLFLFSIPKVSARAFWVAAR